MHWLRPWSRLAWLLWSLAALFASCGRGAEADGVRRLRIAVVPKGTAHDFWQAVHAGAQAAATELGVEITWQGPQPEGDREAQIRVVEAVVTRRVDGLLLAPVDHEALAGAVADAAKSGVPTVVFDSALDGAAHVAFVATDNRRGGELAGERLAERLGGRGRVVVLRYQEGSASTAAREAGCLAALARHPGIQVVSDNQRAANLEQARTVADALLTAHRDVDGVFCPNESTTLGMLRALEAHGRAGKVQFVGFDASPPLSEALAAGRIDALVVQDPAGMGRAGVGLLVRHLRREQVPAVVHTELVVATKDNLATPAVRALLFPEAAGSGK